MDVSYIYLLSRRAPAIFPAPPGGGGVVKNGSNQNKHHASPAPPQLPRPSTKAAPCTVVIGMLSMTNGHKNIAKKNVVITHPNSEFPELFRKTERNKINIWLRWLFARLFCPWICPTKCDLYALFACNCLGPLVHIPPGSPEPLFEEEHGLYRHLAAPIGI